MAEDIRGAASKQPVQHMQHMENAQHVENVQHVFIIGSKSIGQYGGYETFVDFLIGEHENDKTININVINNMGLTENVKDIKRDNNITKTADKTQEVKIIKETSR